jgi:hypothetical protein
MKSLKNIQSLFPSDIPRIIEVNSSLYGTYYMELFLPIINLSENITSSWDLKHSFNIDSSYQINGVRDWPKYLLDQAKNNPSLQTLFDTLPYSIQVLYLVTDNVNKDWFINNKNCDFSKQCPTVKKIPIVSKTEKQINKFIDSNYVEIDRLISLIK